MRRGLFPGIRVGTGLIGAWLSYLLQQATQWRRKQLDAEVAFMSGFVAVGN
jgi:hypothetical protein